MKNDVNMGRSKNEYRKIKMKENGVNWKRLKSVVLKHPNESRLKYDEWILIDIRGFKSSNGLSVVRKKSSLEELLNKEGKEDNSITPVIGLDCEMVEVVGGESALARISIVNYYGSVLMNTDI